MPSGSKHPDIALRRATVRGTISYLESQGLPVNKSAIFRHFHLSKSQGYAAINEDLAKKDNPEWEETRGRPAKVTATDQQSMENVLWDEQYEDIGFNWGGLAKAAGVEVDCNPRTIHRAMGTLSYRRCLRCGRCWTHQRHREKRGEYARKMLEEYPQPQSWHPVRFSGELHFGFGLDGNVRLYPRAGEKLCAPCDDEVPGTTAWPRDMRRIHAWAAIGYGFKSELVFYEPSTSPGNNGDLSMAEYRDKILEKVVKPWVTLEGSQAFILEEDADSFGHGSGSKVNLAQEWKHGNGLRRYFGCGESPDLSPLDSLWPPSKQWSSNTLKDWDEETLKQAAIEAWSNIDQDNVNIWVDLMPQRLQHVIDSGGRLVPW